MRTLYALILLGFTASVGNSRTMTVDPLSNERAVRDMLGADSWARIIKIDNSHPRGQWRYRVYPRTIYALVFELSGILWLYTDMDGTQSFSLTLGTLARDKADPGPLLRAIEPGIGGWEWVSDASGSPSPAKSDPPNACFEESLQAFSRRLAVGAETMSPRLLFYYVNTPNGTLGHTVLLYGTREGLFSIDPQVSPIPIEVPPRLGDNLRSISEFLRGGPVTSARSLPLAAPKADQPGRWASIPVHRSAAG